MALDYVTWQPIIRSVSTLLQVTPAHQVVSEVRKLRRLVEKQTSDEKIAEIDKKLEQLK